MYRSIFLLIGCFASFSSFATDKIELLPHQSFPVEYLYNSTQKGLLVNHALGSGKTILALGFAEKYTDNPVYIIVPYFLKSNWDIVMERYGIKGKANYTVLSYEEAAKKLVNTNLENAIVIIDEVHKLIATIRSPLPSVRQAYVDLYFNLRKAFKILALTGTPLCQDSLDLAYILNLVAGEDILPFNQHEFKLKYTKINSTRALWRGHITESIFLQLFFPQFAAFYALGFVTGKLPSIITGFSVGMASSALFPIINSLISLETYKLRLFNAEKLKDIAKKYVSFYEVPLIDKANYPTLTFVNASFPLSKKEYKFLLKLIDRSLNKEELTLLLAEEGQLTTENDISINSTLIQENLLNIPGIGREISNMVFKNAKGQDIYPDKFKRLLQYLNKGNYPAVIYSNYYQLGILNFVKFLDDNGYKNRYKILDPTTPLTQQVQIINDYNQRKLDVLLLHPDVTEGISLNGTQEFHILEQVLNISLLDQIIGRAVRYQSHTNLPKEKQTVKIILWNATLSEINFRHVKQKKQNWRASFGELNDLSDYGKGRVQIDKYNARKSTSPDQYAHANLNQTSAEINGLQHVFRMYSIESL